MIKTYRHIFLGNLNLYFIIIIFFFFALIKTDPVYTDFLPVTPLFCLHTLRWGLTPGLNRGSAAFYCTQEIFPWSVFIHDFSTLLS